MFSEREIDPQRPNIPIVENSLLFLGRHGTVEDITTTESSLRHQLSLRPNTKSVNLHIELGAYVGEDYWFFDDLLTSVLERADDADLPQSVKGQNSLYISNPKDIHPKLREFLHLRWQEWYGWQGLTKNWLVDQALIDWTIDKKMGQKFAPICRFALDLQSKGVEVFFTFEHFSYDSFLLNAASRVLWTESDYNLRECRFQRAMQARTSAWYYYLMMQLQRDADVGEQIRLSFESKPEALNCVVRGLEHEPTLCRELRSQNIPFATYTTALKDPDPLTPQDFADPFEPTSILNHAPQIAVLRHLALQAGITFFNLGTKSSNQTLIDQVTLKVKTMNETNLTDWFKECENIHDSSDAEKLTRDLFGIKVPH
jgi:hypothetical protein